MILSELTSYLRTRRRVPLRDLSLRFDAEADALRGMLSLLERKGRVRKLPAGTLCGGGCNKCDAASVEIYEWVDTGGDEGDKLSTESRPSSP
jgi:hypothetical protein